MSVLGLDALKKLNETGSIYAEEALTQKQIQPASVDLRLGGKAIRVRAGFLPGKNKTVSDSLSCLKMHEIDISESGVLERGAVYIIPLQESLQLPEHIQGVVSPKSSTGRLDILTRLITDYGTSFDKIPLGFSGQLYLEVTPLTFSVIVRKGDTLTQLRLRNGCHVLDDTSLAALEAQIPLVYQDEKSVEANIDNGLWLGVDLVGEGENPIIGYRSRSSAPLVDLRLINHYSIEDFWEPIYRPQSGQLILNPEEFYILTSCERIVIPPEYSCEMMPYETSAGELRVHYAGFFDPGFGYDPEGVMGNHGVLEVRSHDVPFVIEHGQKICRMVYEKMDVAPPVLYGEAIGSNYAKQRLKLAKQFRMK